MNLRLNKWAVAFREKTSKFLDKKKAFLPLKYDYKGFYADPFIYDYDGDTYLFVEYYPYWLNRGVIAYAKYNHNTNSFGNFKTIIKEDYHLSYPLIFTDDDNIYLMPEASASNSLYIYKCINFPDVWEKHAILIDNVKLVDTTPFIYNEEFYAFTKVNDNIDSPMMLLKISTEDWSVINKSIVTDDISISRPGGKVITSDGEYYLVTQDCKDDYGTAINFIRFTIDSDMNVDFKLLKKVTANDIQIRGVRNIKGIHTYNFNSQLELIDYKYPIIAPYRDFWRLIYKIKKVL